MNLGNKIVTERKKLGLSQEELADKVGVTRQTISKWELEETTPDINQAKILSQIFSISLDELTDNNVNDIITTKISNTEKLAGITIKILKIIGIGLLVFLVLMIILIIIFTISNQTIKDYKTTGKVSITCQLENEEYLYEAEYNKNFQVITSGGDAFIANHVDIEKYADVNQIIAHIEDYFKEHNGSCKTN